MPFTTKTFSRPNSQIIVIFNSLTDAYSIPLMSYVISYKVLNLLIFTQSVSRSSIVAILPLLILPLVILSLILPLILPLKLHLKLPLVILSLVIHQLQLLLQHGISTVANVRLKPCASRVFNTHLAHAAF